MTINRFEDSSFRFLVNSYPDRVVPAREKSARNQSLGYELTLQHISMKTHTQTYSLLYKDTIWLKSDLYLRYHMRCVIGKIESRLSKIDQDIIFYNNVYQYYIIIRLYLYSMD